jgi:hypothetical protein
MMIVLKNYVPRWLKTPEMQLIFFSYVKKVRYCYTSLLTYWWLWSMPLFLISILCAHCKGNFFETIPFIQAVLAQICLAVMIIVAYSAIRVAITRKTADYFAHYRYYLVGAGILFGLLVVATTYFCIIQELTYYAMSYKAHILVTTVSLFALWPFFSPIMSSVYWMAWLSASPWLAWIFLLHFDGVPVDALVPGVIRGITKTYVGSLIAYSIWLGGTKVLCMVLEYSNSRYLGGFDWYCIGMVVLMPLIFSWWHTIYVHTVYAHPATYIDEE